MSLNTKHPLYVEMTCSWEQLRDFYAGSATVKEAGTKYLPATAGMLIDGMGPNDVGLSNYVSYLRRARVPEYTAEAVEVLLGLLHQKDATIELPPELEYLRANSSVNGEPLSVFHRRINAEQLITGRLGLLVDMPENPVHPEPYMALYTAESIINWDDHTDFEGVVTLNMVVLDETYDKRMSTFNWKRVCKYRVLALGDIDAEDSAGNYSFGVFEADTPAGTSFDVTKMQPPMLMGRSLEEIPFVFINTKDNLPKPDRPPLMSLCELCLGIYLSEADYRQSLYMQSQDTLVVSGGIRSSDSVSGQPDAIRTGAGARIDVDTGGDAKYIGVSSKGLSEQRLAIDTDRKRAEVKAGELVQSNGSQQESGNALTIRFTAQTATLNHIALSGAAGLERAIRVIAKWKGADPAKVKVTPNLEFVNYGLDGQNFLQIMDAKEKGFPISLQSLHALAADRGLTLLDWVTEQGILLKEKPLLEKLLPEEPEPPAPPAGPKKLPAAKE